MMTTRVKQMNKMRFIGIIPARFASSRFPGKPLKMLAGRPIIEHVYERVKDSFDETLVATDDQRIADCVRSFGGKCVMTSARHRSGTDRCFEAYGKCGGIFDVIVNVQGDEPFIQPSSIEQIKNCFNDSLAQIATLVHPFGSCPFEELQNPNAPKVIFDKEYYAICFSRSVIPYLRSAEKEEWPSLYPYYKHIGLYAYRADVLRQITSLPLSPLEKAESLEQMRWIESGYKIKVAVTDSETIGIDTPDDLKKAEAYISRGE